MGRKAGDWDLFLNMAYVLLFVSLAVVLVVSVVLGGSLFWRAVMGYDFREAEFAILLAGRTIWSVQQYRDVVSIARIKRLQTLTMPLATSFGTSLFREAVGDKAQRWLGCVRYAQGFRSIY